jgi:LDH2 family malate/lactate/ureidoglycolate dehydrogenase
MAIDYGMFGNKADIEVAFSDYLVKIRSSARSDEQQCIYTHGQKETLAYEDRIKNGIYLNDKTILEIKSICELYKLNHKDYLI